MPHTKMRHNSAGVESAGNAAVGVDAKNASVKCYVVVIANSHRHARHDKTVLSMTRPIRRCELDSRQLKAVADRKCEV